MCFWTGVLAIAAILTYATIRIWRVLPYLLVETSRGRDRLGATFNNDNLKKDPYSLINPLLNFAWQTTEPLKLRPFKPKYHLTMGMQPLLSNERILHFIIKTKLCPNLHLFRTPLISTAIANSTISELVEIDKTYLSRLALRKQIMLDHHPIVLQASPSVKPAVNELYTWLVSTYLPTRFPTMFTLSANGLLNHATSESIPITPPSDPIRALEILGGNIDDDFIFLLPSDDGDGYVLKGFVTCFPSGFNTKEKFGLKLRDIHKPVPGYKEKLEKSMDRFFDKIEVGRIVLRTNVSSNFIRMLDTRREAEYHGQWAITTHDRLFAASGNHLYEGEVAEEEEIDINNVGCLLSVQRLKLIASDISQNRTADVASTSTNESSSLLFQDISLPSPRYQRRRARRRTRTSNRWIEGRKCA
jgi:hypothetical protein